MKKIVLLLVKIKLRKALAICLSFGKVKTTGDWSTYATRAIESVSHKYEQCRSVPCAARPTWAVGLGTEGL